MKPTNRLLAIVLAAAAFGASCSPNSPSLPSDASPAAVAALLAGTGGTGFLTEITNYSWPDEGREPSELFDWISDAAKSSDQTASNQAGTAAHALAGFLADKPGELKTAGHKNPALLSAYANALIPYQGAMVGDSRGTSGFDPLDNLVSALPRTAAVFTAMGSTPATEDRFASEARSNADAYETRFAEFASSNPSLPDGHVERSYALWSGRLRGLLARAESVVNPDEESSTLAGATSQLRFAIVSRMVHGSDPRIGREYFDKNGSLISPTKLKGGPLSLYNAQLMNYLSTYPQLATAVTEFERVLGTIANG